MQTRSSLSVLPISLVALASCAGDASGGGASTADAAEPNLVSSGDDTTTGDDGGYPSWSGLDDSGALAEAASDASAPPSWDSGPPPEAQPSVPDASCVQPLGPGVLAIDELMIESVKGTGDYGEWLEVQSASSCAVNLRGLHGECPVGLKLHTLDVTMDMWLPPAGTFVIADTADPAIDHYLPGPVVTWTGQPGDVLRNEGSTVTLTFDGDLIDTVTYPAFKLVVGVSIAFPSSCPPSSRSDWTTWQMSVSSWFPGFDGTPNAPNGDVTCP